MGHPAGLVKIAEGREAEMFALDDERVLRLYRGDVPAEWIERGLASASAAAEAGIRVPRIYGREQVDGRPAVIMERIPGTDLLTEVSRKPWRVRSIGSLCGRVHAAMNKLEAPPSLETNHTRFRRILSAREVPEHYKAAALAALDKLPEGDRLCHGDFHPGNVMMKDGEAVVIDWSNGARSAPEADYVRSTIMYAMGELPPGSPLLIRFGALFARRLLTGAYFSAYHRGYKPDPDLVRAWRLPVAVVRITEGIEAELPKLTKYIDGVLAETR
jgi:aminoglycoside phosphotransferase (APT) family kinase protein